MDAPQPLQLCFCPVCDDEAQMPWVRVPIAGATIPFRFWGYYHTMPNGEAVVYAATPDTTYVTFSGLDGALQWFDEKYNHEGARAKGAWKDKSRKALEQSSTWAEGAAAVPVAHPHVDNPFCFCNVPPQDMVGLHGDVTESWDQCIPPPSDAEACTGMVCDAEEQDDYDMFCHAQHSKYEASHAAALRRTDRLPSTCVRYAVADMGGDACIARKIVRGCGTEHWTADTLSDLIVMAHAFPPLLAFHGWAEGERYRQMDCDFRAMDGTLLEHMHVNAACWQYYQTQIRELAKKRRSK